MARLSMRGWVRFQYGAAVSDLPRQLPVNFHSTSRRRKSAEHHARWLHPVSIQVTLADLGYFPVTIINGYCAPSPHTILSIKFNFH